MALANWLRVVKRHLTGRPTSTIRKARPGKRLSVELLEDRVVPTVVHVTTKADVVSATDGVTSLREAVALVNANADYSILLSAGGAGAYQLDAAKGELLITRSTGISGFSDTLQVNGTSRAFHVVGEVNVTFSNFTVTGGRSVGDWGSTTLQNRYGRGGALLVEGAAPNVTLQQMTFSNNFAVGADAADGNTTSPSGPVGRDGMPGYGGAVYFRGGLGGSLTIQNTRFFDNVAVGGRGGTAFEARGGHGGFAYGGAVYLDRGVVTAPTLTVDNSLFENNEARGGIAGDVNSDHPLNIYYSGNGGDAYGGAITSEQGGVTLTNTTFTGNRALGGYGFSYIEFGPTDRNASLGSPTGPGNNGSAHGGAVANGTGTLTVTGSNFLTNIAAGGRLDLADKPFSGGFGGRSTVNGGNGGSASGGAIEAVLGNLVVDESGFLGNIAQGSPGGIGGGSAPVSISSSGARFIEHDGQAGGHGGVGGGARGAAISAGQLGSDGYVTITRSIFTQNGAVGGNGGAGGNGKPNDDGAGGRGGDGGMGGGATGTVSLRDGSGPYEISDCLFTDNRLAGGQGGQGGQGGYGTASDDTYYTGGSGGNGGDGGFAAGGGVTVNLSNEPTTVTIERTTVTANVIAGGWGGTAGHGADSTKQGAGSGGRGGNGGTVNGAGVSMSGRGLTATVENSTIYGNLGVAGDAGNGGSGGASDFLGGDGGDGGTGGIAQGGGLAYFGPQAQDTLTLMSSTIAGNVLEAGGAGRGGNAGSGHLNDPGERTLAFSYGGRVKSIGSSAIFLNAGFNPFNPSASIDPSGGGIYGIGDATTANDPYAPAAAAAATTFLVGGGLVSGIAGTSAAIPPVLAGLTFVFTGHATLGSIVASAGSFALFGAPAFATVGLLAVTGAVVTGLAVGYAIQAGSLEAGFNILYDQAYRPAVGRYDMATLFFGGNVDNEENFPNHEAGEAGARGTAGTAAGGGVFVNGFGRLDIERTIVADNRTVTVTPFGSFDGLSPTAQRDQLNLYVTALTAAPSPVTGGGGIVVLPGVFDQRVLFEDLTTRPTDPTIGGFQFNQIRYRNDDFTQGFIDVVSHGANFIGGTASPAFDQPLDQKGTFASPLNLKSAGRLAFNGGLTATLKLREDSPARRGGPTLAAAETAQNGYTRPAGARADIGAWGGATNQAPAAGPIVFNVEDGKSLTLSDDLILSQVTDANGDGLVITSVDTSGLHGVATVKKSGNFLDTATNVLRDSGSGVVRTISYSLAGVAFSGDETLLVTVSDGVTSTVVPVTIHVYHVNKAPTAVNGTVSNGVEDRAVDIDLRAFVTDEDTPAEFLSFTVGGATHGTVALLPDGHTARFTPDANYNGSAQFTYTVTDPGYPSGPVFTVGPRTVTVSLAAVNDAPVNRLPAAPTLNEDAEFVLSGVSVDDVDNALHPAPMRVTLGVQHGTLTLGQTTGLTFAAGDGTADATMTFTGTPSAVNAALASIAYRPAPNFNGTDTLTAVSDDMGNYGAGGPLTTTSTLAITVTPVNDAPTIAAPGPLTGYEDNRLAITGLSVGDVDITPTAGQVEVTLAVTSGTLSLGTTTGLTITAGGNGTRTVTFRGTLSAVNTALAGLTYLGNVNFSGTDALSVSVNDLANGGPGARVASASVAITVRSAAQQAADLSQRVTNLENQGVLTKSQADGLRAKLNLKGNNGDAGKVGAFINSVQDLRRSGVLTQAQADDLLYWANLLLASVGTGGR